MSEETRKVAAQAAAALTTPSHSEAPSSEEMFARWRRTVTPVAAHEALAYFEGTWQTETHLYAMPPGDAPIVTHGEALGERLFGGRFLQMLNRGAMAVPAGPGAFDLVELEGLQTLGYDTYRNLYVGSWIDSLSTSLVTFSGTLCEAGPMPVLNLFGQQDEALLGIVGRSVKYVYRLLDEQHFDFELHDLIGCEPQVALRIAYTRTEDSTENA